MDKVYFFVFCGYGSIAKRRINDILKFYPNSKFGIFVRNNERFLDTDNLYFTEDFDSLVNNNPKAAFICNPSSMHLKYAIECAKKGIDLFIEKPLDTDFTRVPEFLEIINKNNIKCMMGFDFLFHPGILKLKQILDQNIIGKIISIESYCGQYLPDWRPYQDYRNGVSAKKETGGGVLFDLIHEINYAIYLIGKPKKVFCYNDKLSDLDIETEDIAKLMLRFENGCLGYIHLDYIQKKVCRNCKIIGSNGIIKLDLINNKLKLIQNNEEKIVNYDIKSRDKLSESMIQYFLNYLENEDFTEFDHNMGKESLLVVLNAKESNILGKEMTVDENKYMLRNISPDV